MLYGNNIVLVIGNRMPYTEGSLKDMHQRYVEVKSTYGDLVIRLWTLAQGLSSAEAQEYARAGVCRRLKLLSQCIVNIFEIFPPDRKEFLSKEEAANVDINLHAFFINISGVFDNLAWVFVYEYDLFGKPKNGKLGRRDVGLFNENTQAHLPDNLKAHLTREQTNRWHEDYCKNYRDSLAHRIPLYVPPAILDEEEGTRYQEIEVELSKLDISNTEDLGQYDNLLNAQKELGSIADFFAHSIREGGRAIHLHPQLLIDFEIVEEIIGIYCDEFSNANL